MPLIMDKPENVSPQIWAAAQNYMNGGAAALNNLDESISVRRGMIRHLLDIGVGTSYTFFETAAKSKHVCSLEKGYLDQSRVAIMHSPCVKIEIGWDALGTTAGPFDILGTYGAGAVPVAGDVSTMMDVWKANIQKLALLRRGVLTVNLSNKLIMENEIDLTRFAWPGGVVVDGPGTSLGGAFPALTTSIAGGIVINNGIQSVENAFTFTPNQILAGTTQLKATIEFPQAPSFPAGYKPTLWLGFDCTIFSPSRNG